MSDPVLRPVCRLRQDLPVCWSAVKAAPSPAFPDADPCGLAEAPAGSLTAPGAGTELEPQALDAGGKQIDPLVISLAEASRQFDGTGADPERNCWMAVHRHVHGILPSEYDIREVPEELYLAVLDQRRRQDMDQT
jgi:hypothetical protein